LLFDAADLLVQAEQIEEDAEPANENDHQNNIERIIDEEFVHAVSVRIGFCVKFHPISETSPGKSIDRTTGIIRIAAHAGPQLRPEVNDARGQIADASNARWDGILT
jgi:hypothetical protein